MGPPPSKRSAAAAARSARLKEWETAIAGRGAAEFTAYTMSAPLAVGQLLRHAKFGDGVVRELIEGNKAAVLFQDGPHTLVHG
ncbi:MAG: hypothetical protein HY744_10860 [Deltaproteobacteria bacterium]|nr:hypothetical protein [Deltaproteobacteria bacterium]